ncbi:hypothetical protein K9M79_00220 [Candidatus Woesearchaeota archaeon]|nr:hypothetical protein [Candidatus Woesearchaeota archaeon]
MIKYLALGLGLAVFAYQWYKVKKTEFLIYTAIFFYAGFAALSAITMRFFTIDIQYLGVAALLISISALYTVYPLEKYITKLKKYIMVRPTWAYMKRCVLSDLSLIIIIALIIVATGLLVNNSPQKISELSKELLIIGSQATSSSQTAGLSDRMQNVDSSLMGLVLFYLGIFFVAINLIIIAFYSTRSFIYSQLLGNKPSWKDGLKLTVRGYVSILLLIVFSVIIALIIKDWMTVVILAIAVILFVFLSFHMSSINYEKKKIVAVIKITFKVLKDKILYSLGALSLILFIVNLYLLALSRIMLMSQFIMNIMIIITLIITYIYIIWVRLVYFNISTTK